MPRLWALLRHPYSFTLSFPPSSIPTLSSPQFLALLQQWTASQLLVRILLIRPRTMLTSSRIPGLEEAPVPSRLKGRQARLEGPFQS